MYYLFTSVKKDIQKGISIFFNVVKSLIAEV
ncbi:hypothetical protein SAMN04488104_10459 [Algoriphagus faecimaris]|uniref:Uncharacterized protein n=1 Tax=Algoriphagus faecimaris TaxID=686796 RepID=A0A1G6WJU7_9BACT|nr:hypothetical protein SAMN04488104_10459 [Algoriphagus faecimaris]